MDDDLFKDFDEGLADAESNMDIEKMLAEFLPKTESVTNDDLYEFAGSSPGDLYSGVGSPTDKLDLSDLDIIDSNDAAKMAAEFDNEINPDDVSDIDEDLFNFDDFLFDLDDRIGKEAQKLEEVDLDYVADVSIYDTVEREDPFKESGGLGSSPLSGEEVDAVGIDEVLNADDVIDVDDEGGDSLRVRIKRFKRKLKRRIEKVNFVFVFMVLLIFVLVCVTTGGLILNHKLKQSILPKDPVIAQAQTVNQSNYTPSRANYIYYQEKNQEITGPEFIKLLPGRDATVFYFADEVRWSDYDITLEDDLGNYYQASIDVKDPDHIGRKLKFPPLDQNARGVKLILTDKSNEEPQEYTFRFERRLYLMPAAYLNNKSTILETEENGINLEIINASLSYAETNINYKITWLEDVYYDFDKVTVNAGTIRYFSESESKSYVEPRTILGNVRLAPVDYLNGTVKLNFENVYYTFDNNTRINPVQLFVPGDETPITYDVGEYQVVLERLGKMGPYFVLVLHGKDSEGDNIETSLDVELELKNFAGETFTVTGDVRAKKIGTDVLFNTADLTGNFNLSSITGLVINKTKIKSGNISYELNLDSAASYRDLKAGRAIEGGKAHLLSAGFEQAEIVYYECARNDFTGVYRGIRDGRIDSYLIYGEYKGGEWSYRLGTLVDN